MVKLTTMIMTTALGLTVTAFASAGSVIRSGYGGKAAPSVGNVLGTPTGTTTHTGTLPFTGLNLLVFAAIALLLLVLGAVLVRTGRRDQIDR
jgi:hypothetical protein